MSSSAVSRPRVYVRIRPLNEREEKDGKGDIVCCGDAKQKDIFVLRKEDRAEVQTRFDCVFDRDVPQEALYDCIGPEVLRTLFSGYNASIFAYGQTGSGKTYTMEGDHHVKDREGLIPRILHHIYQHFEDDPNITDAFCCMSIVQIYQEKIQDLLNERKQLEIHMDRTGQYVARDATWLPVTNLEACMKYYGEASKMRSTSATEMNLVSSRSHIIVMLKLQWDEPSLPGSHAQLNMVDLAGSERLSSSGATGETMMEAIHINKSLSALGTVVSKLVEQAKHRNKRLHIPYKDSKLTYLLQSSLGGANLMHFILAVSASALWRSETISTIEFGRRALQMVLRPVRNAIDYTRLAEMEAMIERMRCHIASLEEELQMKRNTEASGFLQLKQISQMDDEKENTHRRRLRAMSKHRKDLKMRTELARIVANLPETFDDLTSHCILFPESKAAFRELEGLEKLVHFVDKSTSVFYRSNAAHALASVIDDLGREKIVEIGGLAALTRLLQQKEERCKEAACVAIEAVCRGHLQNKEQINPEVYRELVELVYEYPNQQVQEAACTAIATIVDAYPVGIHNFEKLNVIPKLLETIRTTPEEVVNLTKAATNCIGRIAHGDAEMQKVISSIGGVDILIDLLFSPSGLRDHQVPILASYALVNLCCSNAQNMEVAQEHPRYAEVKFRLLEGLARAFGNNTAREGFGRATAQETESSFPYFGVTVLDKWTSSTSGGRPIFPTFVDNPQFYLYVREKTTIAFIIQDTLYEMRMRKKKRNNAVYMGLSIFEGDPELAKAGLKLLDSQGKVVEVGRYTSNCEHVLHCTLPASDVPYVVVPFTSQRGRQTEFALSAFGDHPIELTAVPEQVGWVRATIDGCWTEFTGRSDENFDWRCNSQIQIKPRENCRIVCVLSYLSLERQRSLSREEDPEEINRRPRLHGRIFTNSFAPEKRYLKALVPLPKGSTFVASNTYSTNSYITTSANLKRGENYVFIPFTEEPVQDTWRLSIYCDVDDVEIRPMDGISSEWHCTSFSGIWEGKPVSLQLDVKGKMVAVANSPHTFLRLQLLNSKKKKLEGIDSFWSTEASAEFISNGDITVQVEGMMPTPGNANATGGATDTGSAPAKDMRFDLFIFTENPCKINQVNFMAAPSALPVPTNSTSGELLRYPREVEDPSFGMEHSDDEEEGYESDGEEDGVDPNDNTGGEREAELLQTITLKSEENKMLQELITAQTEELQNLRRKTVPPSIQKEARHQTPRRSSTTRRSTKFGNNTTSPARGSSVAKNPSPRTSSIKSISATETKSDIDATKVSSKAEAKASESAALLKDTIQKALLKINSISKSIQDNPSANAETINSIMTSIKDVQKDLYAALEKVGKS